MYYYQFKKIAKNVKKGALSNYRVSTKVYENSKKYYMEEPIYAT